MNPVITKTASTTVDRYCSDELAIPSIVLMENAAVSAANIAIKLIKKLKLSPHAAVFCGSGNNGGDGFALARHLLPYCDVKVYFLGYRDKMTESARINLEILENLKVDLYHCSERPIDVNCLNYAGIIIDALIGVGGSGKLRDDARELCKAMNSSKAYKLAIDTPTGLDCDAGEADPDCVRADATVTMFAKKRGMLLSDGPDLCGKVFVKHLTAPQDAAAKFTNDFELTKSDFNRLLPKRKRVTSKFDYGKVCLFAGSKEMPGAGALVSNAAIRAGSGLVYLFSTGISHTLRPEIIPTKIEFDGGYVEDAWEPFVEKAEKCDVIAMGSGVGSGDGPKEFIRRAVERLSPEKVIVLDADGLKSVSQIKELNKNVILTPHIGEFAALTGRDWREIGSNAYELAKEFAKEKNCVLLLKGASTIITDGDRTYINTTGNPGMATAGSGDVLTGIIASFAGQGVPPLEAAALGAWAHGRAGDLFSKGSNEATLTASDLIENLQFIF